MFQLYKKSHLFEGKSASDNGKKSGSASCKMHSRCNFIVPNCLGFSSCSVSAAVASDADVHG